jgi:hypothetical protein
MKKEIKIPTNRILSVQTKHALLYALKEAEKNKSDVLTLKFVFYGLLKASPSGLNKIINNIYKRNGKIYFNTKTLLYRCERSFKKDKWLDVSNSQTITLSKSLRTVLYSWFRETKITNSFKSKLDSKNYTILTTISLFKNMLKNQTLKNWLINEIFLINNSK